MKLRLGISTCPNDTFAFHAILNRKVDLEGLEFELMLLDVQELNEKLLACELDLGKVSFHAAMYLVENYGISRSGAAIGEGVGPVLLGLDANSIPEPDSRVLCPGALTTATLLFKIFYPDASKIEQRLFSEIMPALAAKSADFGVVIHEGRFTYTQYGLSLIKDLGVMWEDLTKKPLPLGGIAIRYNLGLDLHLKFARVLERSIVYGYEHREFF